MSPSSSRCRRVDQGFTLIELLVVVGIMAIVAAGVIMVYDDVQRRAELNVAKRQLAFVRDALLRFRVDMGHFPGEGPLAREVIGQNAYLNNYYYVDGSSPSTAEPAPAMREDWATHPLNLWVLFEKPLGKNPDGSPNDRWAWKPTISRGWQGPYLSRSSGWLMDGVGKDAGYTTGAPLLDRVYAIPDLISRGSSAANEPLRWVQEDSQITNNDKPNKTVQVNQGRPIAFIIDRTSTPPWIIYRVVSAGADGVFQTVYTPAGDDIAVEVTRRRP